MPRLLWLAFAAAVAALLIACLLEWLFPKSARWLEDEDGVDPYDERVLALTYYWQTDAGVQPVVQIVPVA